MVALGGSWVDRILFGATEPTALKPGKMASKEKHCSNTTGLV